MNKELRHYENRTILPASPEKVFAYADDHANFSSHMNKSLWMMGGGKMNTHVDDKKFQEVGSHIQMEGTVFGIKLYLDEVVTEHEPPHRKEWQTVGDLNLLVIDHYRLGFEIEPASQQGEPVNNSSKFKVYIDYDIPKTPQTKLLGYLFGKMYAKWCVQQMIKGAREQFTAEKRENL